MPVAEFPPPLAEGDRVGIAALSGPVESEALAAGITALEDLGLRPVLASNLESRTGLFAGADRERASAFMGLASDPTLKAIFFARGGHGILRVLADIDWRALGRHPRAYIGYSDVTPFLNLVVDRLGLVSFHGPMVAVECAQGLAPDEHHALWGLLTGAGKLVAPVEGISATAGGVLKGGCLSLLAATSGTRFAADLRDAVLFWEDVAEPLYKLDRMLTQLRLSGSLSNIKAMVAGRIELVDPDPALGGVPALVEELGAELSCPTGWGLSSGHCRPNLTLPLGARARLDAEAGTLEVEAPRAGRRERGR